jgi:hypothetical protein
MDHADTGCWGYCRILTQLLEEVEVPAMYDAIKNKFMKKGDSEDTAQSHAAAIFNARAKKTGTPFLAHYVQKEKAGQQKKALGLK